MKNVEAVVAYSEVLTQHLGEESKESHTKIQTEEKTSQLRFKLWDHPKMKQLCYPLLYCDVSILPLSTI